MRNLKYTMIVAILLIVTSCKQEQYYLFNDDARIQFGPDIDRLYLSSASLSDTTKSSTFYYDEADVVQDTVYFDIYTVGKTEKVDRSFKLRQVQEEGSGINNAKAGTHYIAFDDPNLTKHFVIKANTVHTQVPIILIRDASLKTSTQTLKFEVVENENFKIGESTKLWRKVNFTDRLSKPDRWDNSTTLYYFGKYSRVKHEFMIEVTNQRWDQEFMLFVYTDPALRSYYQSVLSIALVDYNNAHPEPKEDEDGEPLVFP